MRRRDAKKLLRRISKKADWINDAVSELETLVKRQERQFAIEFYAEIMKELELDKGRIPNNAKNRKVIARLNKVSRSIQQKTFSKVVNRMWSDFSYILTENSVYYGGIIRDPNLFKPTDKHIRDLVFQRLGFNSDGTLVRDGYMQGLFESHEATMRIKDYVRRAVFTSSGFEGFKKGLNQLIEGEKGKMGIFSRFYRNYAYDVYSQTDAMQGKMFAEELDLKYFIYNGGLIKTSRDFCIKRNGKVFSTKDAVGWEDDPDNRAKPPNYDPLIHRGGYGCRHSLDYITEEVAELLGYDIEKV